MSLWDNEVFKSAYDSLSIQDKEKYKKIGEQMYNPDIDYNDPKIIEYNYAKKIRQMLIDGLAVKDLTIQEKMMYLEAFGPRALDEYMPIEKKKTKYTKKNRQCRMVGGKRV